MANNNLKNAVDDFVWSRIIEDIDKKCLEDKQFMDLEKKCDVLLNELKNEVTSEIYKKVIDICDNYSEREVINKTLLYKQALLDGMRFTSILNESEE